MAHYAKIENSIVRSVIVADESWAEINLDSSWLQTSYNTRGNMHLLGGEPLRYNYAGIGYTYDADRDAFIPPKPSEDAVLDEATCLWIVNDELA